MHLLVLLKMSLRICFQKCNVNSALFVASDPVFIQETASFTGALSDLIQSLTTEISLKMLKNAFYFILQALYILKLIKALPWVFRHVEKRLD